MSWKLPFFYPSAPSHSLSAFLLQNTQFTFVIVMLINSVALKKSSEHAFAVTIAVAVNSWPAISFRTAWTLTSWSCERRAKCGQTQTVKNMRGATITRSSLSVRLGSLPTWSLSLPFTLVKTFQWLSIFNSPRPPFTPFPHRTTITTTSGRRTTRKLRQFLLLHLLPLCLSPCPVMVCHSSMLAARFVGPANAHLAHLSGPDTDSNNNSARGSLTSRGVFLTSFCSWLWRTLRIRRVWHALTSARTEGFSRLMLRPQRRRRRHTERVSAATATPASAALTCLPHRHGRLRRSRRQHRRSLLLSSTSDFVLRRRHRSSRRSSRSCLWLLSQLRQKHKQQQNSPAQRNILSNQGRS